MQLEKERRAHNVTDFQFNRYWQPIILLLLCNVTAYLRGRCVLVQRITTTSEAKERVRYAIVSSHSVSSFWWVHDAQCRCMGRGSN